jgi:lactoylglutathione lyase
METFMKFGYTIIFVENVLKTVEFYKKAFGILSSFASSNFAQMQTGETILAFGANANERKELPILFRPNEIENDPAGFQVSFLTDDVEAAFTTAVSAGAIPVIQPSKMPWGQIISRVRDCNGVLVSIVTPFHPPA